MDANLDARPPSPALMLPEMLDLRAAAPLAAELTRRVLATTIHDDEEGAA